MRTDLTVFAQLFFSQGDVVVDDMVGWLKLLNQFNFIWWKRKQFKPVVLLNVKNEEIQIQSVTWSPVEFLGMTSEFEH